MARKIVDLSVSCSADTDGVEVVLQQNLPVYEGHECYAYDLALRSHTGTYFETAAHLFRDAEPTSRYPLENLMVPGVCVKIRTNQKCVTGDMLESAAGPVEPERAILVDTGEDIDKYFARDAGKWFVEQRALLMGSNTLLYDTGFDSPTGVFTEMFGAGIPIVAGLVHLDLLPRDGFTVIALPLNIDGICVVPCRVVATLD